MMTRSMTRIAELEKENEKLKMENETLQRDNSFAITMIKFYQQMEEKIISEKKRDHDQSVEDSEGVVHNGRGDFFIFKKWTQMSTREKYTAYSRTSDGDNVKINTHEKPNYEFYNELQHFFKPNYVIYKWTSSECNDIYVGHTKDFEQRKGEHLHDAKTKNNELYKKMREFGGWTMERLDDFYAPNRREAEKKEQEWIDKLNSNLNMHNAYKVVI